MPRGVAPERFPTIKRAPTPRAGNENVTFPQFERTRVLDKLIANKDFVPTLRDGRMTFRSLTPEENNLMNRIGWGRAPDVHPWQETAEDTAAAAWERNIRYWLSLAKPQQ